METRRLLTTDIIKSLGIFPVVGIIGSRQVGKTTLAKTIKTDIYPDAVYLDLERPSDYDKLNNAETYLKYYEEKLVIIDEIQRKPDLFPVIRSLVDDKRRPGRFLILGSASPSLKRQSAESLAGRIIYHELNPICLREFTTGNPDDLWVLGGYPPSIFADSDESSFIWRESFIETYLERDIPQLGFRVPAIQLRRFMQMLSHIQGQLWNANKIAASMGVSNTAVNHYLGMLSDTFMLRILQPYFPNIKKRIVKSPKVYIRDVGILHALLNIKNFDELISHPSAGASWESWVIEQILAISGKEFQPFFYRTAAGAEIDLVLVRGNKPEIAIEVKRNQSPSISRSMANALADLKPVKSFIVYPGDELYPVAENVIALPDSKISNEIFELKSFPEPLRVR